MYGYVTFPLCASTVTFGTSKPQVEMIYIHVTKYMICLLAN